MLYSRVRIPLLLTLTIISGCSCEDFNLLGGTSTDSFPPDTTCRYNNPDAEYDETIPELCDGIDNDCDCLSKPVEEQDTNGDGTHCGYGDEGVDEGCECYPRDKNYSVGWAQSTRRCWTTADGRDVGVLEEHSNAVGALYGECEYGKQQCRPLDGGGSEWGAWFDGPDRTGGTEDDAWIKGGCNGAVGPATEICDGKDNNCNGRSDEGLKRMCWSGASDPDGTPQDWLVFGSPLNPETPCRTGIELCEDGVWSGCQNEILPAAEICNGIDDDCDGDIDDNTIGEGDLCGLTDAGICGYGTLECNGQDLVCEGALLPQVEECDSMDNDCDGDVDEELLRPCESLCGSGFETCSNGSWAGCTAPQPTEEVCDGADNDCDGAVDEGLECTCPPEFLGALIPCASNPKLTCGTGFMECICVDEECSRTAFSECMAMCAFEEQIQQECDVTGGSPVVEECNAWDDDCDDDIDEGLQTECYTGPPGTANTGRCIPGTMRCQTGRWGNRVGGVFVDGVCAGEILPADEVCNNLDDDCDGDIDEDLESHEKVDMVFAIDRSGSMCGKILALRQGMQPYVLEFANTEHRFALVNIPGPLPTLEPNVEINLVDSVAFAAALAQLGCNGWNDEPQYDAVDSIARNTLGLQFRDDAWPMIVVMTDEHAQSLKNPRLTAADVRAAISPCQIGSCEADDILETYVIAQEVNHPEWCAPANIARKCYNLYPGITSVTVRGYLDDIFSDVCR